MGSPFLHSRLATALCVGIVMTAGVMTAQGFPPLPPDSVQVAAQGEFKAAPDTAVVSFEIHGQDRTLDKAYAAAQAQAEAVRNLLRAGGIAPEQAHLEGYSVVPNMDWERHILVDYSVNSNLRVNLSDFKQLGPLIDRAGAQGQEALRGVSFQLLHPEAAKQRAIVDAFTKARAEAEALATAAGRHLGALQSATVDVSDYQPGPRPMMAMAAARSSAPTDSFTPDQIQITAHVQALFHLTP